jgi:HEAT repeats
VLRDAGLIELQNAALISLGRIKATASGDLIAGFLESTNPMLRARAVRTLGDIRDERFLPRIRGLLRDDPAIDCRLAAVSALGKFRDREAFDGLVAIYGEFAAETGSVAEQHGKVVLLALSKILNCEEVFAREWRREERLMGSRLPGLAARLAAALRRHPGEQSHKAAARLSQSASDLAGGDTGRAFDALQSLRSLVAASQQPDAAVVGQILDGTRHLATPQRALLVLLCLVLRRVAE